MNYANQVRYFMSVSDLCSNLSQLPSLIFYVPEVSEVLKDGAFWFNFVFGEFLCNKDMKPEIKNLYAPNLRKTYF